MKTKKLKRRIKALERRVSALENSRALWYTTKPNNVAGTFSAEPCSAPYKSNYTVVPVAGAL